jgi:WD40 repeat protein
LAAASDWRAEHPEDLSTTERDFLDASARAADAELEEARTQAAREAQGRRDLRRAVIALSAVVVLAVGGGIIALYERGTARREAARAERAVLAADSRRLAALAASAPDIATSSLLAVAAYRLQDSADSRGALLNAVERNQSALWRIGGAHRPQRIAATADGSRIAVNDPTSHITVVDPRTRRQVASFPADGWVEGITPDGRQVVTYALPFLPHAGRLAVWDIASHTEHVLTNADVSTGAEPISSSNGRWVAAITAEHVGAGQIVDVFDAQDWSAPPARFVTSGEPIAMAAGRSVLAVEHRDGSVEVRSVPSLHVIGSIPAGRAVGGRVAALALSPDGAWVARVDPADPLRAAIYRLRGDVQDGIELPSQPQTISALAFAPDGSELALGSESGSLNLYRTSDGDLMASLTGHAGGLHGIAWTGTRSPTGLYTVGLDGQLVSWDLHTGPRTVRENGPDRVPAEYAHAFGSIVAGYAGYLEAGGPTVRIYTLDLRTGRYATWPAGFRDGETSGQLVASDDGRLGLASIIAYQGRNAGQNRIEIVDLRHQRDIGHLALPPGTSYFADSLQSAITPDGRYAYCALGRDRVGVFALPSGRYLRSFTVRFDGPGSARIELDPSSFDPHGRLLVYGYDPGHVPNQRLGLIDAGTGRLVAQVGLGDIGYPASPTWSHDGHLLAFGTSSGTVEVLDAATLKLRADTGVVTAGYASTVSFAPDDSTLVSAGTDSSLNFWTVPDLRPEGGRVVIGSGATGGVFAWFAPTGDVVGLAPDVRAPDSGMQRWFDFRAEPAALAKVACQLAGSDLTRAQWQRYVGDVPYQHVCSR